MDLIDRLEACQMLTPTPEQWAAELWSGWRGPDGSTFSPDVIAGVRIGVSTAEYTAHLPANRHDFRYRIIRRLLAFAKITIDEADALRLLADREHLRLLRAAVAGLPFFIRAYGVVNAHVRYRYIRRYGAWAIKPTMREQYIARELTQ